MNNLGGLITTSDRRVVTLVELQSRPVEKVSLTLAELLDTIMPEVQPRVTRKERKKRNMTSKEMSRRHPVKISEDDTKAEFVLDPSRPWETGKTLTKFHLFKKLAPEMRQMIWAEVFPNAQAVKIMEDGFQEEVRTSFTRIRQVYIYRAKATYVPSPLLFVNRESRATFSLKYPLAFAAQLGGRPIRFNFEKDILHFESPIAMINFYGGTLPNFQVELETFGFTHDMSDVHDKVQHVAIGNVHIFKGVVGGTLNQYKALKSVILGDARGQNPNEPHDLILDFITGDERLGFGWERFQNFKTKKDKNMPSVKRYRKDVFDKLIRIDYKQYVGPDKHVHPRGPRPALESSKGKDRQGQTHRDKVFYSQKRSDPASQGQVGISDATETNAAMEDQKLVTRNKRQRGIGIKVNC